MVTLEDKFAHFSKLVLGKAQSKYEEQLREVDKKNQEYLEQFKKELEVRAKDMKSKALQQGTHEKKLRVSRAQLDRKRKIMVVKDELMETLMLKIQEELIQYTRTEGYAEFIKERVKEFDKNLEEFDGVVVQMKQSDVDAYGSWVREYLEKQFPGLNGHIAFENLSPDYIGGIVLFNEQKTIRYDATVKALLEDWRERVGELLHDTFDKAGMNNE